MEDILVSDGVPCERRMNGMIEGELARPLLMMSTTERLSEYMRMDLLDYSCPHRTAAATMG